MNTVSTLAHLNLLGAIGGLKFRPMSESDRCAFDGADDDAQIADANTWELTRLVSEFVERSIDFPVLVIASGPRLEIHGISSTGDPICLGFDVTDLL